MPYETVTTPSESRICVKHTELGFAGLHLQIAPVQERTVQINSEAPSTDIPEQFVAACAEGIRECIDAGIIEGHPIEYAVVTLLHAEYRSQDSTVETFKHAGRVTFRDAFLQADPIVVDDV